ncbi:MAG TPA: hypothetical protein VGQ83_25450 [Polyangia bacterium]|jgi:hypothetical protein
MTVSRFTISFDAELARAVRRASGRSPISAWLADAARRKLRVEGLLQAVREWEGEHGELQDAELRTARRRQRPRRRR